MKNNIKLVCFDLNKTLIEEDTWDKLNVALGMTIEEDQKYYRLYYSGQISYVDWIQTLVGIYKIRGKAKLETVKKSVSQYNYKAGAKEIIEYLRGQGYHIALISGSINILVDVVAEQLGIKMAEANNRFIFDEAGNLEGIETVDSDDLAKLQHLENFCNKLGIDITECACVGDGDNDIELFKKTRHGITFKGSKIESSAWRTVEKLSDIKEIL